ncbi:fimbrial protein [Pseudomonas sp. LF245]
MIPSKIFAFIIPTIAITTLLCSPGAMAACYFDNSTTEQTLNFGAGLSNTTMTVPQDAPIGTVIFTQKLYARDPYFSCNSTSIFGFAMNSALGTPSSNEIFPLGDTGLSFRIATDRAQVPYLLKPNTLSQGSYHLDITAYTFEVIKTKELSSKNQVPAGFLGNYGTTDLALVKFNLTDPINLNTASCQTPSVSVNMGDDYQVMDFDNAVDPPRAVKFNIGLNQCQSGINKVTYSLKANTKVIDAKKGAVALDSSSTAKGIGLKIMDEVGQPIALDTTYTFNGFSTSGTSFNIPLFAAYYRLPDSYVGPGLANSSVTFIVNYL